MTSTGLVTGDEVRQAMTAANITRVLHHDCSICGVWTFHFREGDELFYNSACGCSWSPPRYVSWEEAAGSINMQNDEWREKMKAQFGFAAAQSPTGEAP